MNDGVKILLERMQTHPEEFIPNNGSSKWGSLIAAYSPHLHLDDHVALRKGMDSLLQQAFTEKVLEELVDSKQGSALQQLQKAVRKKAPSIPNISLGQTPIAGVTQTV